MNSMKTVRHNKGTLHIETPLGIVNIRVGLHDEDGRMVESISILGNEYVGELPAYVEGMQGMKSATIRLVQLTTPYYPGS